MKIIFYFLSFISLVVGTNKSGDAIVDMGVLATIKIEVDNEDYFVEIWNDSKISGDSILVYSEDQSHQYVLIDSYLRTNIEAFKDINVYSNFQLFSLSKYLSIHNYSSNWNIYSGIVDLKLIDLLGAAESIKIVNVTPFEGQYITNSISDYDWEWMIDENFTEYFSIRLGPDSLCDAILIGPEGYHSTKVIDDVKRRLLLIGDMSKEYMRFLDELYQDYDFIVIGYCSC